MEFSKREIRKLNTKGCCFICLRIKDKQIEDKSNEHVQPFPVQHLLQYLRISTVKNSTGSWNDAIHVCLCESCGKIIKRFSVLFQQLEKIQMEMGYFLELIHQCISGSSKDTTLVQVYSKRMTSDLDTLTQLAFVDNLRKTLGSKALEKQTKVPRPCINLIRTNIPKKEVKNKEIKIEDSSDVEGTFDELFESAGSPSSPLPDSGCILKSPISSPNPTSDLRLPENLFEEPHTTPAQATKAVFSEPPKKSTFKKLNRKSSHPYYTKNYEKGIYQCRKCPRTNIRSSVVYKHYKTEHLKERYKCDICNTSVYTVKASLIFHQKTCQENIMKQMKKEMDPLFKFNCQICGKKFDTKDKLRWHRNDVHNNINRYDCDLCDKKFPKLCQLKNHKDAIHFGKVFYCEFCNVKCRYKSNLKKHKKTCPRLIMKVESSEK